MGCFTERGVARKVYALTGVHVERVKMVTPTDALVEFVPVTLVVTIAQALDQIMEWEDTPVWVSVLMGNKPYIMKLCQERVDSEEQRKAMEAEVDKMHEQQQEQQDKLSELIDKVNDQARMCHSCCVWTRVLWQVARQRSDGDQLVVAGLGQLVMGVTFIPLFNGRAPLVATEREVLALFCTPTP